MENISELNSKWYWRFVKVIGLLVYILILTISSLLIYDSFSSYNPEKLESAKNTIVSESFLHTQLENIQKELPGNNIKLNDLEKIINEKNINNINTLAINFVMLEHLGKTVPNIQVCGRNIKIGCNSDPVGTYVKDSIKDTENNFVITISNKTYQSAKTFFNNSYPIESEAINSINKLIDGESISAWSAFYDFKNLYKIDINNIIGKSGEYRGLSEYLKIISSIIGVLLGLIIINFILLRVIYYIILGKIFPNK